MAFENITRTLLGSYLQTCLLTGAPFQVFPNTTLNQKLSIQANTLPSADQLPKMRYFAIGNAGHALAVAAGGRTKLAFLQHEATDFGAFGQLPFVLRTLDNDLTSDQQKLYGLRRLETYGGVQYVAYYLRRIDFTGVIPGMQLVSVVDGVSTVSSFTPTAANLNPTPPTLDNAGVNTVSGDYAAAQAVVSVVMTAWDAAELVNVANVMYNDPGLAIISEVQLVSGVDKVVTSPAANGGSINFNEVIAAQVVSHVSTFFAASVTTNGMTLVLDVGATEPLYRLS